MPTTKQIGVKETTLISNFEKQKFILCKPHNEKHTRASYIPMIIIIIGIPHGKRGAMSSWDVLVVWYLLIPSARRRERPKKTWHQQIKDDMTGVGVTQDVALDRKEWKRRTRPTARR